MIARGAIELRDVRKNFRSYHARSFKEAAVRVLRGQPVSAQREVLRGLTLSVRPGERLGIVGGNGAGKSTLFRIISKIYQADSGTVLVGGRVSSLIEITAGLVLDLNGRENIRLNAALFGLSKAQIEQRLDGILDAAGLTDFADTPTRYYSSGMQARLAFSVAVQVDADVLLIDEVLAVGDAAFQEWCIQTMRNLSARGTTIVLVSHDRVLVDQFCTRVVSLNAGTISEDSTQEAR